MLPVCVSYPFQDCGMMGAKRKFDHHTGIDLYCDDGAEVYCITDGDVIDVFTFTGEEAGSPWWNTTQAVVVKTGRHVYVYGEVSALVNTGDSVNVGSLLGRVVPVLKTNKGKTPQTMLHFELWDSEDYIKNCKWELDQDKPRGLRNPIGALQDNACECQWLIKTECGYILEDNKGSYLRFFSMAADSKAFLANEYYIYLNKASSLKDKLSYTLHTSKTLWFDNK